MSYPDASMHDTNSHAWRDICFARWICKLPDREARLTFVGKLQKRHGAEIADHFAGLVRAEWGRRAQWAQRDESGDLFDAQTVRKPDVQQLELVG